MVHLVPRVHQENPAHLAAQQGQQAQPDPVVIREPQAQQVQREPQARLVPREQPVLQEQLEEPVLQVILDQPEELVLRDRLGRLAIRVLLEPPAQQVMLALRVPQEPLERLDQQDLLGMPAQPG